MRARVSLLVCLFLAILTLTVYSDSQIRAAAIFTVNSTGDVSDSNRGDGACSTGATQTIDAQVSASADDAYHTPGGWPGFSATDKTVYAGYPGSASPTYGGWRWEDLNIPAGAVILDAYVELSQHTWGYEFETILSFEDSATPGGFTKQNSPYTRWSDRSDFETSWTADLGAPGTWISTPDLSAGIQELVDRYGGIASLTLLESGTPASKGKCHLWSAFDGNPSAAAKLHITYYLPGSAPENVAPVVEAGPDMSVSEGSTISLAPANFVDSVFGSHTATIDWGDGTVTAGVVDQALDTVSGSHTYQDDGAFTVTVSVTDNGGLTGTDTFTVTAVNQPPSVDAGADRAVTTGEELSLSPAHFSDAGVLDTHSATVDWGDGTVGAGTVTDGAGTGTVEGSHSYATAGTHTVSVCVTDNGSATGCDSFTVNVSDAPLAGETQTVDAQVNSSPDDAFHSPGGWPGFSSTSTAVYAGSPGGSGPSYGGWRWEGLDIPAGAVIVNAYVELDQSGWGYTFSSTLSLEDSASPQSFSSTSTPYNRWQSHTGFTTGWSWQKGAPGTWVSTPDLSAGIQELADRYGGINSLVLLESGEGVSSGQYHQWYSYDKSPAYAAKLHIEWVLPDDGSGANVSESPLAGAAPLGIAALAIAPVPDPLRRRRKRAHGRR